MKKVGIIVAMDKEWDALFSQVGGEGECFHDGRTENGTEYCAKLSGIGKVNAAVATYILFKECGCNTFLSFGCAGGSNYDVHIGDVIVGDEYMYHDVWCGNPNAIGQVQGCPETFKSSYGEWRFVKGYRHGLIASGDTFVESELMASSITNHLYPTRCPLALDMESAAIAQVCDKERVGFTSVRVISDNPLSGERTYEEFWSKKDETLQRLMADFLKKQ